jgi:meiotically up-regulated gene 157 (Mug157) protein
MSMDLERRSDPLGVPGSESPDPLLLLRVLKIEDTLLSPSSLEFSRCKLKPKRFLKEDAFELTDPVFCETGFVWSQFRVPSRDAPPGIYSSNR